MKKLNYFGIMLTSFAVMLAFSGANAADNGRPNRSAMTARMPTMPVVSLNTVGNPAVQNIDLSGNLSVSEGSIVPTPVVPTPTPDTPKSECEDGGVKNSTYTTTMCMNDILQCINGGALQGGLNDMFNDEVRNSIMGGMRLCQAQIDKCIRDVRVNCKNFYSSNADVWMNFNCSIVQPEYYNFVLRKTGLTPNQAENTCLLIDRNTYGSSFAAVSDTNAVNTEYNNGVGAYNKSGNGNLSKLNPQGVIVNTVGYDGNRGHYARWDASKAECLVRVAAYNKDKLITNSWLFGAVGNNNPAEVWEKAGSTFTCNKELFDFSSLLNDTKTAAVIGVGGGTVLGAAIGAGAGAAVYNKKLKAQNAADEELAGQSMNPCADENYVKKLSYQIANGNKKYVLQNYLYENVKLKQGADGKTLTEVEEASSNKLFNERTDWYNLNQKQCEAILDLYAKAEFYDSAIRSCRDNPVNRKILGKLQTQSRSAYERLEIGAPDGSVAIMSGSYNCGPAEDITSADINTFNGTCLFVPLQLGFAVENNNSPFCNHNGLCRTVDQIDIELNDMRRLLSEIKPVVPASVADGSAKKLSKGAEIGKGLAIGAVTGAAAGGLATGITALIERSNITCKVGDGLNSVALGKSHSIDSLKDFYVKWNLHLPDSAVSTTGASNATYSGSLEQMCYDYFNKAQPSEETRLVRDEREWGQYCSSITDLNKCVSAKIYYTSIDFLVNNPCVVSEYSGKCTMNQAVFNEYYNTYTNPHTK